MLFIGGIFMFPFLLSAQVAVDWFNAPGGVSIAVDNTDNVYTANWEYNPGGDITLTKRNASGAILWQTTYDNTNVTRHEVATWVETDHAGNILVSGVIRSGYSNPVNANSVLMKFSPDGWLLWRVVYETDFDGSSTRKCLVDANNNIYVLGLGIGPAGMVTIVKKFSPSGAALWSYFDNAGIGAPINFKFTPDNHLLLIGRGIFGSINGYAKIDLNGNHIWSLAGVNSLTVGDAAGDNFGNTYLVHGQYVVGGQGSLIKKLSQSGVLLWSRTHSMSGFRVEVGTDNNPVISGFPNSGSGGAAFMKYDRTGTVLWQNLDADGPSYALLLHAQMKLDGANAAYLAAGTLFEMAICKVNSNGSAAWMGTVPGSYANGFDFGTDNSVYAVGGNTARFSQGGAPPATLAAPSNLTASAAGATAINLAWTDNANNETGFVVQRSLSATSGFTTIANLAANVSSYSSTSLISGATYFFRVQATNGNTNSGWSNTASATTAAASTAPAAPTDLTATPAGCSAIQLSWVDNANNETSFELSRSQTPSGPYTTLATLPANSTAYTNTGLRRGRQYFYRIRSVNGVGNSDWSNIASASPACPPVQAPGEQEQTATVFPNPVGAGEFNLRLPLEMELPVIVSVHAASGQKILQQEMTRHTHTFRTQDFAKGLYILTVCGPKNVQTLKILIQ